MSQLHDDPDSVLTRALVELEKKTGYSLMQTNGQRKCGPPPDWIGPPPTKGSEVFIGKIPRNCYENELFPLFAQIGIIYELRLMMDFSGSNRGYGFVMYTNRDDAKRACHELDNYEIRRGRRIGVVMSRDNCRLFVGKIPRDKTKQDVIDAMSMVTDGVVDAIVHTCYDDPRKNRGFAFVEYEDHRSAAMARRQLLPGKTPLWGDVEVQVDWAQPENDLDDAVMERVSNLYIRNLAPNVTEADIANLFSLNNRLFITKVKKIKDFAFVHFKDRTTAEKVLELSRHNPSFGCELSADGNYLGIMWAKPSDYKNRRNRVNNSINNNQWMDGDMKRESSPSGIYGSKNGNNYRNHGSISTASNFTTPTWANNGYFSNDPLTPLPDPYHGRNQQQQAQFSWPVIHSPVTRHFGNIGSPMFNLYRDQNMM